MRKALEINSQQISSTQYSAINYVILLYMKSLDLFTLHDCNFVPFDQYHSISPTFLTIILLSISMYLTFYIPDIGEIM